MSCQKVQKLLVCVESMQSNTTQMACCRNIYGLKQSGCEWYLCLCKVVMSLGFCMCTVDAGVFIGHWDKSPDPTIPMPSLGTLFVFVPVHVDYCLLICNSMLLYYWFLHRLNTHFTVNNLGNVALYISIHITHNRAARQLWLSQQAYMENMLAEYKLTPESSLSSVVQTVYPWHSQTQYHKSRIQICNQLIRNLWASFCIFPLPHVLVSFTL
jgi:hypothetical protein